jgi:hypothetical protein
MVIERRRSRLWQRVLSAALIAAFVPIATGGCFGRFSLTRKVYDFNREIHKDKWIRWFAFLVMVIIPVYEIATLIDALIANSLEFWTGRNPISADSGQERWAFGPNGTVGSTRVLADGRLELSVWEKNGRLHELWLSREGDSLAARDAQGRLLGRVADVNGAPRLVASAE